MIDKTIAQHLQERREVHSGIKNRANCLNVEVAGKNSGWQNKSNSVRGNR